MLKVVLLTNYRTILMIVLLPPIAPNMMRQVIFKTRLRETVQRRQALRILTRRL